MKLRITNNAPWDVTNVSWDMQVVGGMFGFISITKNVTVDATAGKSKTVGTGGLFGFGSITITGRVAGDKETVKGMQFFIFWMVQR